MVLPNVPVDIRPVRSVEERLDDIERRVNIIDDKITKLLEGLQKFLEFTETMKGHPLLSAFAPPPGRGPKKP